MTLGVLHEQGYHTIPDKSGVYQIILPDKMEIVFCSEVDNHTAKSYPVSALKEKHDLCKDKKILYIGKAKGKHGLRQRIRQYVKYGWNEAATHKGGRAIWQIKHFEQLEIVFEICEDCEKYEHSLLREYKEKNGVYPLANWRG